jgi:putative intracellular protease/amidase
MSRREGSIDVDIAIVLYPGFTALDAVGPYEVLSRLPGATVTFAAETADPVLADTGRLALIPALTLAECSRPDVLLVPGGPGQANLMEHQPILSWLREMHSSSSWTTSVCTGSLLLGAAGILEGRRATSHWLAMDRLSRLGAIPVSERIVCDGKVMTAAGVSAGIDMALVLAGELAGSVVAQTIQLGIEYDPHPPFGAGSPETAPSNVVQYLRDRSRFLIEGDQRSVREPDS